MCHNWAEVHAASEFRCIYRGVSPSAFFMIVDSKIDSLLCREHDVANQGFATLPTSLRILSSHVAVAAPGPDLVAILRRKQLVLDALTSDMGMTPDLRCFNLSPGHVERGLCGTLTVRSASERSFYSVHKLRMTKTSETQSYTFFASRPAISNPSKPFRKELVIISRTQLQGQYFLSLSVSTR